MVFKRNRIMTRKNFFNFLVGVVLVPIFGKRKLLSYECFNDLLINKKYGLGMKYAKRFDRNGNIVWIKGDDIKCRVKKKNR